MGTINPRARGGAPLGETLRARRLREEQIGRQRVDIPKPKPAASGGGVVGMAQVFASVGSVTWGAGEVQMNYTAVTYDAPTDPNSGSGGGESSIPVSSWLSTSGYQLTVTPGWYIPVLYMRLTWTTFAQCPVGFGGPYMNGGWDAVHNDNGIHPAVRFATGGGGGLVQIANHGPTYMGAGTDLHAELRSEGGAPSGANDPSLSAIVWNITKLG